MLYPPAGQYNLITSRLPCPYYALFPPYLSHVSVLLARAFPFFGMCFHITTSKLFSSFPATLCQGLSTPHNHVGCVLLCQMRSRWSSSKILSYCLLSQPILATDYVNSCCLDVRYQHGIWSARNLEGEILVKEKG